MKILFSFFIFATIPLMASDDCKIKHEIICDIINDKIEWFEDMGNICADFNDPEYPLIQNYINGILHAYRDSLRMLED